MKYLYTFILILAITFGYSQTTLVSQTFDSDAESWAAVGDGAGADGLFAWEDGAGNTGGAISFGGSNSDAGGSAYQAQFVSPSVNFGTTPYLVVTFDLKVKTALVATAVHFQIEAGGVAVQNSLDIQNDGLNATTWTSYTVEYDGIAANADGTIRLNFNLAAGAEAGHGGELLLDNVVVTGYDSDPTPQTQLVVSVDGSQYLDGTSGFNIVHNYGGWTEAGGVVNNGDGTFSYTFLDVPADTMFEYVWKAYHSADNIAAGNGESLQESLFATAASGGADNLTQKLFPNPTYGGVVVNEGLNTDYGGYGNRVIKSTGASYSTPAYYFTTLRANDVDYAEIILDGGSTSGGSTAIMHTSVDWGNPGPGGVDNGDGTYTVYADPSQAFEYYWKLDDAAESLINCTGDSTIINTDGLNYANRIHGAGEDRSDEFNTCPPGTLSIIDNELGIIEIYPNPFLDRISVNTEEAINVVRIYDLTGRMVKQANPNNTNFNLDVADLSKGIYLIKLNAGDKEFTTKLIK